MPHDGRGREPLGTAPPQLLSIRYRGIIVDVPLLCRLFLDSTVMDRHKRGNATPRGAIPHSSWGIYSLRAKKTQSFITLKMEAICSPKRRLLIDQQRAITQDTLLIITAVKTSHKTAFFGPKYFTDDFQFLCNISFFFPLGTLCRQLIASGLCIHSRRSY
jgi:hypothetical protein